MKSFLKTSFLWIWSKKWWALAALIVLGVLGFWLVKKYWTSEPSAFYVNNDYTVATGDVVNSLSLAGTTQFANAQKLTFVNKGRVTSVRTKIGANVKKGDILATITTDDLDREVETAKKNLKNQQLKLQQILEKSNKELDILRAQSNYDLLLLQKQTLPSEQLLDIQTKKSELQELERQIKDKEKDLKEAKLDHSELLSGKAGANNAELALSELVRKRNNDMLDLVNGFRTKANELQTLLEDYDALVKLSDLYTPNDQNIYLGAKNVLAMNSSKNKYWEIRPYVEKLQDRYTTFSAIPVGQLTENQILSGYAILKELGNQLKEWWKINATAFVDSIETADLTREKITSYVRTYGTAYEDKGFAMINDYSNVVEKLAGMKKTDTTVEDSENKIEKLNIELEKLKIQLQKNKNELEVDQKKKILEGAELDKKIEDARVDLEKAKSWNTQQEEIESLRNEIDNAQFNLTTLMKKYDEYKIIANFDGVVTKLDMQVGDSIENNASSDTQKYIYVETPDLLEVALEVDQIDIVKLSLNMPVTVSVDAFPGEVYSGYFSEIDTMPNGNSYKASVVFQKHSPEEKILGGMTANVNVILNEERGKVVIPNPAIVDSEFWTKIVRLKKGESWIDQEVEIGITDDMNTVILSGLKEGDIIKELYINDTSMQNFGVGAEDNNGFGGMWWWRWPWGRPPM